MILARMKGHGRAFAAGMAWLVLTNVAANATPWVMKRIVEVIEAAAGTGAPAEGVGGLAALLVALAIGGTVVRVLSRMAIFNGARDIEYELRNELFAHLMRLSPSYYRDTTTGDLMSRVTNDVSYVRLLYGPGLLNVVNTVCAYAMALPLLFVIDVRLTLYTVLPIPVMMLLSQSMARAIQDRQREVQDELSHMSARLHESLAGIAVVKAYAMKAREERVFDERNGEYLRRSMRLVAARGLFLPLVGSIAGTGALIVLVAGGHAVAHGRMTLGALVAFLGYLAMLTWPTLALGWVISTWQRGVAALVRIDEVLSVRPTIADPPGAPAPVAPQERRRGALEVRDLSVSYGDAQVLHGVSLSVPAGGSLGVVGRTGSGKSTLVRALCRFTEIPSGAVFLDGADVCTRTLAEVRGAIALVPQESFLFSTSLLRNIAFVHDDPEGQEAAVARAAQAAALTGDVDRFPQRWQTLVGERGVTLSGGQKQRAAIARALFADRPVLVLDDALSSVDSATERAILAGVRAAAAERTCVIVSHRMTAVAWCDEIVVLDGGRVVERGSHADLVRRAGGWYAEMWAAQQATEAAA